MACTRCGGLMVVETCSNLIEEESRMKMNSARCLNCGNIEDATIEANRNHHVRCLSSRVPGLPVAGCSHDRWVDSAWEASRES